MPIHQNSLEALLLITQAMQDDGRLKPALVVPDAGLAFPDNGDMTIVRPTSLRRYHKKLASSLTSRFKWAAAGSLGQWAANTKIKGKRFLPGQAVLAEMGRLHGLFAQANHILDEFNPRVLVLADDRKISLGFALSFAAKQKGVPSILVPWAYAQCRESIPLGRRGKPQYDVLHPMHSSLKKRILQRHPNQVFHSDKGPHLYYSPASTTALAILGMLPPNPWCPGGGFTDLVAVAGEYDRRRYLNNGVPEEKLIITDDPSYDELYEGRKEASKRRKNLIQEYGLPPDLPILVCAVPQLAEHGLIDWKHHWKEINFLVENLSLQGCNILLSLHPKSMPDQYHWLEDKYPVHISRQPLREILPCADIFLSTFSSTVRWAVLLRIPTIIVDFYGLDYNIFDHYKGAVQISEKNELLPTLQKIINDAEYANMLRAAQDAAALELAPFQGRARQNLVDIIADM